MKKLWNLKITPYKSGQLAEFVCRLYMRLHGYRIIAKNYKCGSGKKTSCGELDFVAAKGKRIVFCEVKKRKRIMRGGEYFMKMHKTYRNHTMQFDVFFVRLPFYIHRIPNALHCDYVR